MDRLLSEQAVINAIEDEWHGCTGEYPASTIINDTCQRIENLPSAEPQIVRVNPNLSKEEFERLVKEMKDTPFVLLPTVEPQKRKGHWIDKGWTGDWQYRIDGRGNCWRDIRCSECNTSVRHKSNFCPNCGARMEVTE